MLTGSALRNRTTAVQAPGPVPNDEQSAARGPKRAMIGAVTTVTCKRCGLSFETEATTNTRCRRCKTVVRVPASAWNPNGRGGSTREHTISVVLLSCGHPTVVVVHPGRSIAAILKRYDWECSDTGATVTATRVLRLFSEAEWENVTDQDIDLLVSTGAAS